MSAKLAACGLTVPSDEVAIPAIPDLPANFHITMAAIDPTRKPDDSSKGDKLLSTLVLVREPIDADLHGSSDEDEDESSDENEDGDDDSDEDTKSKPMGKSKTNSITTEKNGSRRKSDTTKFNSSAKKMSKRDNDDDNDVDMSSDNDEDFQFEEFVVCTLDSNKVYQQPLDITIGANERVFFKVKGNTPIHLTGNLVEMDEHDEDSEDSEDYDKDDYGMELSEMINYEELDSEDALDDLENPKISEILSVSEEEIEESGKKSGQKLITSGKNDEKVKSGVKRPANEDEADRVKKGSGNGENEEAKLSKKQLKKLKMNSGEAAAGGNKSGNNNNAVNSGILNGNKGLANNSNGNGHEEKKVQFAEDLEQVKQDDIKAKSNKSTGGKGNIKVVQEVEIDDRKTGTGPGAKKGDKVGVRYIGKLQKTGQVFDANKKGKPFSFKLGAGEVIKGWDIGIAGMAVGGERRITVPAHLAYGSKAMPKIPANSTLVFDVKVVYIKN